MPTYQYRCAECGGELEAVQKFAEPALTECPTCGGRLRKVFSAVGVVFKGSGFYRTDSRADKKTSGTGGSADGSKTDKKTDSPVPAAKAGGSDGNGGSNGNGSSNGNGGSSRADASSGGPKQTVGAGSAGGSSTPG